MRRLLITLIAGALAATSFAVSAQEVKHGDLIITHPHARATPPNAPTGAGYLTITNNSTESDRLVAASAGFADMIQIHEMAMDGNVMQMRQVEGGIQIPPGGTVALEPGGMHIMFMGLAGPLVEGEKRLVTLIFERAGTVEIEFGVEKIRGE